MSHYTTAEISEMMKNDEARDKGTRQGLLLGNESDNPYDDRKSPQYLAWREGLWAGLETADDCIGGEAEAYANSQD